MDTSKVLHVPRKMKVIFWKRCKVLPLQDKTSFNMLWNMLDCHKVPRLPRQTRLRDVWTSKSDDFGRTHHIGHRHGHTVLTRTVADGCERLQTVADGCGRLRTVAQRLANTASTPKPGTLATHSGKGKTTNKRYKIYNYSGWSCQVRGEIITSQTPTLRQTRCWYTWSSSEGFPTASRIKLCFTYCGWSDSYLYESHAWKDLETENCRLKWAVPIYIYI